jgi:hypothetical protein
VHAKPKARVFSHVLLASHDEIARRVELEQEQLAFLQRLEIGAGWSPEIDLREVRFLSQQFEPFMVRDRDNQLSRHLISLSSSAPARNSAAIASVARPADMCARNCSSRKSDAGA